jgi:hypothetical protein
MVLADAIVFHVANKCPFPVWPASAPNTGHPVLAGGGFYVPPGKSRRVVAPATWNGRFWARTGCNFTANGMGAAGCLTGDCEGRLACNGSVGAPPATLVEVSLHEDPAKGSSYDVSLVDGYNLPVAVSATGTGADPNKCAIAGCAKNVNAVCPPELQVTGDRYRQRRRQDGGGVQERVPGLRARCLLLPRRVRDAGDVPRHRVLAPLQGRLPGILQLRVRHHRRDAQRVLRAGVRHHLLPVQMGRRARRSCWCWCCSDLMSSSSVRQSPCVELFAHLHALCASSGFSHSISTY